MSPCAPVSAVTNGRASGWAIVVNRCPESQIVLSDTVRPCQWLGDRREPLPLVPGPPGHVDDVYTRHGTCTLFLRAEPFQGGAMSR
jgi:hypothetical protein